MTSARFRDWAQIPDSSSLFTALWAAALFVHQTLTTVYVQASAFNVAVAAVFAAMACLPSAPFALPLVAAVQLVSLWRELPNAANHWLFAGFVDLSLLGTALALRRTRFDREAIVTAAAPLVRVEVVLLYAIAAFHKLNRDFIDPEVGCIAWTLHWLSTYLRRDLTVLAPLVPVVTWGTIAVEMAIPTLLAFRRTWLYGIALGTLFHLCSMETGFTAIALASYFFFVPERQPPLFQELDVFLRARTGNRIGLAGVLRLYLAGFLLVVPTVWLHAAARGATWARIIPPVRSALWIAGLAALFAAAVACLRNRRVQDLRPRRGERVASRRLYVLPALLVLNGLCPYLGLKTTTAFDMFSNLRVLGATSNHLLLRDHPLRVFGYQADLVRVHSSSAARLVGIGNEGPLPYLQFRREVQRELARRPGPIPVVYERGGRTYSVDDARTDPELAAREALLSRKLLPFRQERWERRRECPW